MKARTVILVVAVITLICMVGVALGAWNTIGLNEPHFFLAWKPSHAMEWDQVNQEFVVAYGGDHLYVARGMDNQWAIEVVDSTIGRGSATSIAIEDDGTVHISYYDQENKDLWYAVSNGSGWATEMVKDSYDSGFYNSIAVDDNGYVFIAYHLTTDMDTEYAYVVENSTGSWINWIIDSTEGCGRDISIALDSTGKPGVAYNCYFGSSNYALHYTKYNGVNYAPEELYTGSGTGLGASLLFNDSDYPMIAYYNDGSCNLVTHDGMVWNNEKLEDISEVTGYANRLFLQNGDPVILTKARNAGGIWLYTKNGTWTYEELMSGSDFGMIFNGAYDNQGNLNVAYVDNEFNDAGTLNVIYPDSTKGWSEYELDSYVESGNGLALALSSAGMPAVSYLGKYYSPRYEYALRWDGSAWLTDQVDLLGPNFYFTGIAFQLDDSPAVIYKNESNELMQSLLTETGWQAEMITTPVLVGYSAKIKADSQGNFHVVYVDFDDDITYAHYEQTKGWTTELIDSGFWCQMTFDMVIGSDSKVHVVYTEMNNDEMRYAHNPGGVWNVDVFPVPGGSDRIGKTQGIALDQNNNPYLVYTISEDDSINLKYDDGLKGWNDRVIETDMDTYAGIGFGMDENGALHISYHRSATGELVYAYAQDGEAAFDFTVIEDYPGGNSVKSELQLDPEGQPFIAYQLSSYGHTKLAFDLPLPQITSVTPDSGTEGDLVEDVAIAGEDIFAASEAYLTSAKATIDCENLDNPNRESLVCDFDLSSATPGFYDLIVEAANGQATLSDAFEVEAGSSDDDTTDDDTTDDDDDSGDDDSSGGKGDDDDDDEGCCGC